MQLSGSTFIVTGAVGGVGEAVIRRFHAAGAQLVVADSDVALGRKLAAELGAGALFCKTELHDEAGIRATIERTREHFGAPNGLIHFAVIGETDHSGLRGMELFSHITSEQLTGAFNLIRLTAAAMRDDPATRGVIINVASPPGPRGRVETPASAACKAGLFFLSLSIASELATTGIRVISIASGPGDEPTIAAWPTEAARSLRDTLRWPNRLDHPDDYAGLVQYVVEHETSSRDDVRFEGLSQRELEVLRLIAQGRTNKDIGRALGISPRTVQVHTSRIYGKIGVANRTSAVLWLTERQAKLPDSGASPTS